MTATGDRALMPLEAARLLSVNPATLARWAKQRRIAHVRTLGGQRRYLESEILALRDRLTRQVGEPWDGGQP